MGTNNHLLATFVNEDGSTGELDIQFRYGELREHIYRVGDLVHQPSDHPKGDGIAIVPGLAILRKEGEKGVTGKVATQSYRYFRILILNCRIISFYPTTATDFDLLEEE